MENEITDSIVVEQATEITEKVSNTKPHTFPFNLPKILNIFVGQNGVAYAMISTAGNLYVLAIGSRQLNNIIREHALKAGLILRKKDLYDVNEYLMAEAEISGVIKNVYYRVANLPDGGIEVDVGDMAHTRVRIQAGHVEIITNGSETLFFRTKATGEMVLPAETGDLNLLKKYVNLHPAAYMLFIAWLSYTLAHPKVKTSKYVILVLTGNQGAGKSSLCNNVILKLIDPNNVGVQIMPGNPKDLAIAAQNNHVLCYDNVREFKSQMSDLLCIAATGGALTSRQLFTDSDQQVLFMHVALVLNGIHSFIEQPDLAQRCLTLEMLPISNFERKSELALTEALNHDLPFIVRGLYDLIANILTQLPNAVITNPERMIDFVQWLAAMEIVMNAPAGTFQGVYSDSLQQGQLESLLESSLAVAVMDLAKAQSDSQWVGTPAELFSELNLHASKETKRSREWPANPIALSKRLRPMQASLMTQGITLQFSRGKQRTITIKLEGN